MERLIVDLSSACWTALFAGTDTEFGIEVNTDGKRTLVNSAQFAYENAIETILAAARHSGGISPSQFILVEESGNSKGLRQRIFDGYKNKSGDKPKESYEQFNLLKPMVIDALKRVGACVVTQLHIEADDVIAYLVNGLKGNITLVTNDGDLSVLLSERVRMWKGGKMIEEHPFGPFDQKYVRLYKALVGDASDTYPGAKGFGDQAFLKMAILFGDEGLDAFVDLLEKEAAYFWAHHKVSGEWLMTLSEDVAEFKPLGKVLENIETVVRCWLVAGLYPDKVNTLRQPLRWQAGMVKVGHPDERLKPFSQQVRLITAENYEKAFDFFKGRMSVTPFVSLDIETSTPEESDEWLRSGERENKVDVLGSQLTGMSLTFGANMQYTYYISVDHVNTMNVTSEMARRMVELVPQEKYLAIHNFGFEGPILYAAWGKAQEDNGWHGFLPNVIDTAIMSSYVDENQSQALKNNSKLYLGYDQQTYAEVTTIDGIQYKMWELSAKHVLSYGADDTICTAALANFFRVVMEIENTWDVFLEVEQLPAYVGALAYHQGTAFSLQRMKEIQKEDAESYAENEKKLHEFLVSRGWEGSVAPCYTDLTPAGIKEIVSLILGQPLETKVRTLSKLVKLVELIEHEDAHLLARLIEDNNLAKINSWVAEKFSGKPVLDLGSSKQMRKFLYDELGLPVRIINSTTKLERQNKPNLAAAVSRHKKIWAGSTTEAPLTEDEKELLKKKAKTDETAIDFALLMDCKEGDEVSGVLKCIQGMKKCATRQSLYYGPYPNLLHWKDGKIHGQQGQSRTVTRRFAPSDPNLSQLAKKGEGVKFRSCFVPHHKKAVMVSIDFAGQELRQGAGQSMDPNMLSCFIGENKKDMHSMTAAGAMDAKWGQAKLAKFVDEFGEDEDELYDLFIRLRKNKENKTVAKDSDDLRKNAKNVNFSAQYDAKAPKIAEKLIIPVEDAEAFLQSKYAMFPRFEAWKDEVKAEVQRLGYATTPLGGRRHLREALLSTEWGVADKALRQGPNFNIQGASAEQTKIAMARLWKSGILFSLDMVFFAPIHDELVWSVGVDDALESIKVIHNAMTQPYGGLPVPFLGSVSIGPNFADQIECGDDVAENPSLLDVRVPEILAGIFP